MFSEAAELKRLLHGKILLFCHHNADPDSLCSAFAVKKLAESIDPLARAELILPSGASRVSRRIMKDLEIEASSDATLEDARAIVTLDATSLRQLGDWGERIAHSTAPKVFIDHHVPHPEARRLAALYIADESSSSTCEIVYGIYNVLTVVPTATIAKALLLGMTFDSRHFTIGTPRMFRAAADLLEIDGGLRDVIKLLSMDMDLSERVARLKAAQRMRVHRIGDWVIASSHVTSFQASAARSLISLGADVAIVVGWRKGGVRASMRSTDRFYAATSIHLGRDVAIPLGEEFGGAGSGHSSSAGVNAKGEAETFVRRAVQLLSQEIETASGKRG